MGVNYEHGYLNFYMKNIYVFDLHYILLKVYYNSVKMKHFYFTEFNIQSRLVIAMINSI